MSHHDLRGGNGRLARRALAGLALLAFALPAFAQTPRVAAVFPAGARVGQSVEVALRGSDLGAARGLLVLGGPGVTATLSASDTKPDQSARPLFQRACSTCHEARSPENRILSPEQWASTVERMIRLRGADIPAPDRDRIVAYLQGMARAGVLTARFTVARDAPAGVREVRLITAGGVSPGFRFEVGTLPEVAASGDVQTVTLPAVVNGALTQSGQKDRFAFAAYKGEKLTFNLKGFRLNERSVTFFNPALYLEDASGKVVAKGLGRFGVDPLIEWTCPADGTYTLTVRDLLWKGNPASIYRLAMGALPYETLLSPMIGRPGQPLATHLAGVEAGPGFTLQLPADTTGPARVATPYGEAPLLIRDLPDGGGPPQSAELAQATLLPAAFSGRIVEPGEQVDRFRVRTLDASGLELYARRLGSGLRAKVTIKTIKGAPVIERVADEDADLRIDGAFPGQGEYLVEVSAAGAQGGVYCWEATAGKVPDFTLTATPDGLNLSPGFTGALVVRCPRRTGVPGPIEVSIQDPPSWLSVEPGTIPPDDDKALVIVTVAPDAPVGGTELTIRGSTQIPGADRPLVRRARPIEVYRGMNNSVRTQERQSAYVGVAAAPPPFSLVTDDLDRVVLKPGDETTVRVKVARNRGFNGTVFVQLQGMPPGMRWQPFQVDVQPGRDEAVFTLRAGADARFLTDRPDEDLPPMRFVFVGTTGEGDAVAPFLASQPVMVIGKTTKVNLDRKPRRPR